MLPLLLLLLLLVDLPDDLAVEGLPHHLHHCLRLGVEIQNTCALSLLVLLAQLTKRDHLKIDILQRGLKRPSLEMMFENIFIGTSSLLIFPSG